MSEKKGHKNYYLPSRVKCSGWASDNWPGRIRVKRRRERSAKHTRPSLPGNNGLHKVSHVARWLVLRRSFKLSFNSGVAIKLMVCDDMCVMYTFYYPIFHWCSYSSLFCWVQHSVCKFIKDESHMKSATLSFPTRFTRNLLHPSGKNFPIKYCKNLYYALLLNDLHGTLKTGPCICNSIYYIIMNNFASKFNK